MTKANNNNMPSNMHTVAHTHIHNYAYAAVYLTACNRKKNYCMQRVQQQQKLFITETEKANTKKKKN